MNENIYELVKEVSYSQYQSIMPDTMYDDEGRPAVTDLNGIIAYIAENDVAVTDDMRVLVYAVPPAQAVLLDIIEPDRIRKLLAAW